MTNIGQSKFKSSYYGTYLAFQIEEAEGGILFVDEAYRLMPAHQSQEKDYGVEALEEIMAVMDSGRVVVIFAGEEQIKYARNKMMCCVETGSQLIVPYSCILVQATLDRCSECFQLTRASADVSPNTSLLMTLPPEISLE